MLEQYRDRVVVAEIDANMPVEDAVDIVLYDSFAQPESDHEEIGVLVANPRARRVVVYTWNFHPDLVESARQQGAHGYLSKTLPARDLVAALEAVHAGEVVVSDVAGAGAQRSRAGLARPRRGAHRPRGGDPGADHPGQEQRRGRRADLPEPQHGQVLHPHDLPQDRCRQPHPGRALGRRHTASRPTTTASSTGAADPRVFPRLAGNSAAWHTASTGEFIGEAASLADDMREDAEAVRAVRVSCFSFTGPHRVLTNSSWRSTASWRHG